MNTIGSIKPAPNQIKLKDNPHTTNNTLPIIQSMVMITPHTTQVVAFSGLFAFITPIIPVISSINPQKNANADETEHVKIVL